MVLGHRLCQNAWALLKDISMNRHALLRHAYFASAYSSHHSISDLRQSRRYDFMDRSKRYTIKEYWTT